MRSSKSRSRAKNRGANRSPANNINRVFDSSGPEGKVRGTPQQIIDKYTQLSRDAFLAGDRVAGENFQQHAEHYTRLLAEAQRDAEEKRQQNDQQNRERQQQKQRDREDQRSDQRADHRADQRSDQRADQRARGGHQSQPEAAEKAGGIVELGGPGSANDSGLVETPEEQPKRKSTRSRKSRSKAPVPETPAAETPVPETPGAQTPGDTATPARDEPAAPETAKAAEAKPAATDAPETPEAAAG